MIIRAAILDDEHIVATDLAFQVAQRRGWEISGVFNDPHALLQHAQQSAPHACFLDIETPGLDGITLARELKRTTPNLLVVFVTAFQHYASAAFRVEAVDYLVKPATPLAIAEACNRVAHTLGAHAPSPSERLAVFSAGRIDYVEMADILAAKAAANYVSIFTRDREYLHRITVTDLADLLAPFGFARTHRSFLVRPSAIVSAKTRGDEILQVTLANGFTAPVSESFRATIAEMLSGAVLNRVRL